MSGLAGLYSGSGAEERTYAAHRSCFAHLVYLLDLPATDLGGFDALYVPEGTHHGQLRAAGPQVRAFLDGGGAVLLFGDQPEPWLPGLDWEFREADDDAVVLADQDVHGFHAAVPRDGASWHHHGVFHPPAGAVTVLAAQDGPAVLYVDEVSTGGTLLVTSLDPLSHYGGTFLPAAGRFLDRFLPWAANALTRRARSDV